MYTVYHLPKSLGRSCRSTHVLNPQYGLHKQAVVPAVTPGSPCLPGSRPLMGSHWSSRKSSLKMASPLKSR